MASRADDEVETPKPLGCQPNPNCKYAGECFENIHHLLFPRNDYRTGVLRRARNVFRVQMCAALQDQFHATTEPPIRPTERQAVEMLTHREETLDKLTQIVINEVGHDTVR